MPDMYVCRNLVSSLNWLLAPSVRLEPSENTRNGAACGEPSVSDDREVRIVGS